MKYKEDLIWVQCLRTVVPQNLIGTYLIRILPIGQSELETVFARRFEGSWIDSRNGSLLRGKVIEYSKTK